MALANQEAQRFNHEYLGTEHILLGIVKEGSGVGGFVLKDLGCNLQCCRVAVEKFVKCGPDTVTMGRLPQTPHAKLTIEQAIKAARDNYVGTEHLLLGMISEESGDNVAQQVLVDLDITSDMIIESIDKLLGSKEAKDVGREFLTEFSEYLEKIPGELSSGLCSEIKKYLSK